MKYRIKLTILAKFDFKRIVDYIEKGLYAPVAAENFSRGLFAKLFSLEKYAHIYAVSTYKEVLVFGEFARSINYKGFAIVYTIHNDLVIVHRIIHGSLVKE